MKNRLQIIILCAILLLALLNTSIFGQGFINKKEKEKVTLFTDRNIYISGEKINFMAVLSSSESDISTQSKVLYLELIAADKQIVSQKKGLLNNQFIVGQMEIPEKSLSGMYYLRVYTKFMRNNSQSEFAYTLLKIVNPKNEKVIYVDKKNKLDIDSNYQIVNKNRHKILITLNKQDYKKHDTILIHIRSKMNLKKYEFLLSAIPYHSVFYENRIIPTNFTSLHYNYAKESSGFLISGKLINSQSEKPISLNNIYLTIKKNKNLIPTHTDSIGRFNFILDFLVGQKEIFISSFLKQKNESVECLIDNDFASIPDNLSFPEFKLSKKEKVQVYKMALNKQINEIYYPQRKDLLKHHINSYPAFYGRSFLTINFDDYILFPHLSDYFTEIDLPIKLVKRKGKREFIIRGTQPELLIYKPLIMLDWVEVQNAEQILSISPKLLSHIEVIDSAYLRGDFIFGGIINFITKKGNFGDIQLPNSTVRLNYSFLSENNLAKKKYKHPKNQPDVKNTLFWKAGFKLYKPKNSSFSFPVGDNSGKFIILLKGIDENGNKIQVTKTFSVD